MQIGGRDDQRRAEQCDHREPCPGDAEAEAVRGREEQREEEDVRRAEIRRAVLTGDAEGDRDGVEHLRLLLDDVFRRPAPHRDRVDPRDDHGDQRRPHHVLEPGEEPEADADEREQLREVVGHVELGEMEQDRERGEREPGRQHRPVGPERQQQPNERERRREEDERQEEEVGPEPALPEPVGSRGVERERGGQSR